MAIVKRLAMANHAHTRWRNRGLLIYALPGGLMVSVMELAPPSPTEVRAATVKLYDPTWRSLAIRLLASGLSDPQQQQQQQQQQQRHKT